VPRFLEDAEVFEVLRQQHPLLGRDHGQEPEQQKKGHQSRDEVGIGHFPGTPMGVLMPFLHLFDDDAFRFIRHYFFTRLIASSTS
jgi:hypothetical protein